MVYKKVHFIYMNDICNEILIISWWHTCTIFTTRLLLYFIFKNSCFN